MHEKGLQFKKLLWISYSAQHMLNFRLRCSSPLILSSVDEKWHPQYTFPLVTILLSSSELFTEHVSLDFSRHFLQVGGGGGRARLTKFKFSTKFPIGLHVILKLQIKKSKLNWFRCTKLFQPKICWGAALHRSRNKFKWALFLITR